MAPETLPRDGSPVVSTTSRRGFARYAVDATLTSPTSRKRCNDNALLVRAYVHVWSGVPG